MSTRTEILAFCDFLSAGLAEQNECLRLYSEVLIELAHDPRAWLSTVAVSNTGLVADNTDPDQLEIRGGVIKLLAMFYSHRQLTEESIGALNGLNADWREHVGEPWGYTRQGEEGRMLRLYPKPRRLPVTGETLSTSTDSAIALYCDQRTTDVPDVMVLPIALLILAREFERESNHRDQAASEVWRAMATNMLDMIA